MNFKKSVLTVWFFAIALLLVSCKNNKKDNASDDKLESEIESEATSDEPEYQNLITENEGEYPRDFDVFDDSDISKRIKDLTGDQYDDVVAHFDTETPVVSEDGIYKFTGCKQHDCPAFKTTILFDANNDNLNVLIEKDEEATVFDEDGEIELTESLEMK